MLKAGVAIVVVVAVIAIVVFTRRPREEPRAHTASARDIESRSKADGPIGRDGVRFDRLGRVLAQSPSYPTESPKPLPRSLDEAKRIYPQAEQHILRYIKNITHGGDNPQMWVRLDDEVRLVRDVDDCVGGKIQRGVVRTTVYHHPTPDHQEVIVDGFKIWHSDLSPDL